MGAIMGIENYGLADEVFRSLSNSSPRSVCCVVGVNGAGKSNLLREIKSKLTTQGIETLLIPAGRLFRKDRSQRTGGGTAPKLGADPALADAVRTVMIAGSISFDDIISEVLNNLGASRDQLDRAWQDAILAWDNSGRAVAWRRRVVARVVHWDRQAFRRRGSRDSHLRRSQEELCSSDELLDGVEVLHADVSGRCLGSFQQRAVGI